MGMFVGEYRTLEEDYYETIREEMEEKLKREQKEKEDIAWKNRIVRKEDE